MSNRSSVSEEVKKQILKLDSQGIGRTAIHKTLNRLNLTRLDGKPIPLHTIGNVLFIAKRSQARSEAKKVSQDSLIHLKRKRSRMMTLEVPPPQLTCKLFLLTGSPDEIAQFSRSL